jgi:formate dehydrogenase major subunit
MGTLAISLLLHGGMTVSQVAAGLPVFWALIGAAVEAILRHKELPHICYHSPLMGPIQTCDTCIVEVDGQLVPSWEPM